MQTRDHKDEQRDLSNPRLGIVIVTYGNDGQDVTRTLNLLEGEKRNGDFIVLVDNHPDHACAATAADHPAVDHVLRPKNKGFGDGCNIGAEWLGNRVDTLLFLNPDAFPTPGSVDMLREASSKGWGAWMGLLLLPSGQVNCAGNIVHVSGLAWCAGYDEPASRYSSDEKIRCLSGANMAIDRRVWEELGGFASEYFLYYEDIDICFRLLMRGYSLGLMPKSHIEHEYNFQKDDQKWFCLERNRYVFIIRTWPLSVFLAFLPMLLVVELGLWVGAILQRRFVLKVRSTLSFLRMSPFAIRSRQAIQKSRSISSLEFLDLLEYQIQTPLLNPLVRSRFSNVFFHQYYEFVRRTLRVLAK